MAAFKIQLSCTVLLALSLPIGAQILARAPYYMGSFDPNSQNPNNLPSSGSTGNCWTAASNSEGAAVTLQPCQGLGNPAQSWTVVEGSSFVGPITIYGTKCLSVKNNTLASGTRLEIRTCADDFANQNWLAGIEGDVLPGFHVQWATTSSCIDLTGGSQAPGTPIQIWSCQPQSNTNQKWVPEYAASSPPEDPNYPFRLHPASQKATDRTLSLAAQNEENPSPVVLIWDDINLQTLNWLYTNGSFHVHDDPTYCLDVTNGVNADGTKLQVYKCFAGNTNQQWQINADYTIQWKQTNKCIDLTDGKLTFQSQQQIWTCSDGNTHQQWKYFPVDPSLPVGGGD